MPLEARNSSDHLAFLDAFRGLASAWVLVSHVGNMNGFQNSVLLEGSFAVDLFMIMSGFLMVHNFILRRSEEKWERLSTFIFFWTRRFFRIAPIFYFAFCVSMLFSAQIGAARMDIATFYPSSATAMARYEDHTLTNIIMHITLIFGYFPEYASRTPLPDWSIGLEWSYYALFPLIMLSWRYGAIRTYIMATAISVILLKACPEYFGAYTQPAALPLKIHTFLAGMLIATAFDERMYGGRWAALCFLAIFGPFVAWFARIQPLPTAIVQSLLIVVVVIAVFHLRFERFMPGLGRSMSLLSARCLRFLGDTSYAVYLIHLPLVILVVDILVRYPGFTSLGSINRIVITFALVAPIAYPLAWGLHASIEKTGISCGRHIVRRLRTTLVSPKPAATVTGVAVVRCEPTGVQ